MRNSPTVRQLECRHPFRRYDGRIVLSYSYEDVRIDKQKCFDYALDDDSFVPRQAGIIVMVRRDGQANDQRRRKKKKALSSHGLRL
jgi:hypothetical protein